MVEVEEKKDVTLTEVEENLESLKVEIGTLHNLIYDFNHIFIEGKDAPIDEMEQQIRERGRTRIEEMNFRIDDIKDSVIGMRLKVERLITLL